MKQRFSIFLLVALLLMLAVVPSMAQDAVLRYPITSDPEHLNPFISDTITIGTVNRNIYEGLVRTNPSTNEFTPAIAESWTSETNAEGQQVYTFTIRPGVLFHNVPGVELEDREVTADDILWNYLVALNPSEEVSIRGAELDFILGAPEYTAALEEMGEEAPLIMEDANVAGLQVIDDYTFQITLSAPDRLFLVNGMISITSPEAYTELGEDFNTTPVGTGPYRFVEWLREDHLTLAANEDYYLEGLPKNDGVEFINYGDENTALLDYREDNLDFLFSFPSGQRTAIIEEFGDEFHEEPGLHLRYWGFNMNNGFLSENLLVRQALSHSLDRETAWDVFAEGARFPANLGMLPPSMPAATPSCIYNYDLDRAAELLTEAGFPNGEGMPTLRINLLEAISEEAQVVVWEEALTSLGLDVEFVIEDGSTYFDTIVTDETMIFQNGWAAGLVDPSDSFDFLILDGNGSMRYDNPEVNELLRAARVETDAAAREEMYQQVHDIVMCDAVLIPSAYSKVTWLVKPWVEGFVPGGGGTYTAPLWEVELNQE
jgi:peptide/nickel transport system substrate-binding protein